MRQQGPHDAALVARRQVDWRALEPKLTRQAKISEMTTVGRKIAKSEKSTHRRLTTRDRLTAQALRALAKAGDLGPDWQLVVRRDENRRLSRTRKTKTLGSSAVGPGVAGVASGVGTRVVDLYPEWFERPPIPTKRKHHRAPQWRDVNDELKAELSHWALSFQGDVFAFTLDLGGEVERRALAKGAEAARWISQAMHRNLAAALHRTALFWFRLELGVGDKPYLHLHGEIACSSLERAAVRKALRKAGGDWKGLTSRQAHIPRYAPDTGWVGYSVKADGVHLKQQVLSLMGAPHSPSWRDKRFFISQDLSRLAKMLYEDVRTSLRIETTPIRMAA